MDDENGNAASRYGDNAFLGQPVGKRKGCVSYDKVLVRGTVFQCGEDVIVAGCAAAAADENSVHMIAPHVDDWVAQITAIYKVNASGTMCMDLTWYYRHKDIPKRLVSKNLPDPTREIFFSDHVERKQPIHALKVHAVVLTKPQFECVVAQNKPEPPPHHIFIARYQYNANTERIGPLKTDFFPRKLPQTLQQVEFDENLERDTSLRKKSRIDRCQAPADEADNSEPEVQLVEPSSNNNDPVASVAE